jgi:putative oxidoreductase
VQADVVPDLGVLVFRAAVGAVFLAHGVNHIFGGGRIRGTARWFASLGMKPGIVHAWLASLSEIAAGVGLVLGLCTPVAAAAVIGTMLVAGITNHRGKGFFIFRPGEGWEYVMTLGAAGVLLACVGAGRYSLDHALGFFDPPGTGGVVAAAAGGLASLALLAFAWRPAPRPQKE